jgi:thiol-disulfide isomerase/thioredoxin
MLMTLKETEKKKQQPRKKSTSSSVMQLVRTMEEFKATLRDSRKCTVAIWTSPWCKACKSLRPAIWALAKQHPNFKFIEIPVLDENANLHQGLEVPSVPYFHLYLPEMQLAEEEKLNRKRISMVHKMLQDYQQGECSLERLEQWSTSCPYSYYPVPPSVDNNDQMPSSAKTVASIRP